MLLPQGPENRDEGDRNQNVEQDLAGLLVEDFARIRSHANRWDVDKLFAAEPKDECGNGHENSRKSEGNVRAVEARAFEKSDNRRGEFGEQALRSCFIGLEQPGNQKRGKGRPGVDRKIEPVEDAGEEMLVRFAKFVAHVRRDTWFDSAGPKGNH